MTKKIAALIVFVTLAFYSVPAFARTAIVQSAFTCNGIKDNKPVDYDDYFDIKDNFIEFYAVLQIVDGPCDIVERWYDPDGVLIALREHKGFSGGELFNFILTKDLAVDQRLKPSVTGWYKVELSMPFSTVPFVSIPFMYSAHM